MVVASHRSQGSRVLRFNTNRLVAEPVSVAVLGALAFGTEPGHPQTTNPPKITSAGSFTAAEGETAIARLTANDPDTSPGDLCWSETDGADSAAFTPSAGGGASIMLDVVVTVTDADERGRLSFSSTRAEIGSTLTATLADLDLFLVARDPHVSSQRADIHQSEHPARLTVAGSRHSQISAWPSSGPALERPVPVTQIRTSTHLRTTEPATVADEVEG